jgi:hypothetical protein
MMPHQWVNGPDVSKEQLKLIIQTNIVTIIPEYWSPHAHRCASLKARTTELFNIQRAQAIIFSANEILRHTRSS